MKNNKRNSSFLLGTQYYRAPTPDSADWEKDLRQVSECGIECIKVWAQWRWISRRKGLYEFSDLDQLLELAEKFDLKVVINVIFDAAPVWLAEEFPDSHLVLNDGRVLTQRGSICRSIGGTPGPCYNHAGARSCREEFLAETVRHFRKHSALSCWDVWNEPEQTFWGRKPEVDTIGCYCDNCRLSFQAWLADKYESISRLNQVWGRCYNSFAEVEPPRHPSTFMDMVDWREFFLDVLSAEADWRIETVKKLDLLHTATLHVVPNNLREFNTVTCVDDFSMFGKCDAIAGTVNGNIVNSVQLKSCSSKGKFANYESHLRAGSTGLHPAGLSELDIRREFLPQIGQGADSFMFWQYRPELIGEESPAWGLSEIDGSKGTVLKSVQEFFDKLQPYASLLHEFVPQPAEVYIYRSRRNEIFSWCVDKNLSGMSDALDSYVNALYQENVNCCFLDKAGLLRGVPDSCKLLLLPEPYLLGKEETDAIASWVENGGVVFSEAHLAGYDDDSGRHSFNLPGCGLHRLWKIRQVRPAAKSKFNKSAEAFAQNLPTEKRNLPPDVQKALAGAENEDVFPVYLQSGGTVLGERHRAALEFDTEYVEPLGWDADENILLASVPSGAGHVIYAGTYFGRGGKNLKDGLRRLVCDLCRIAGVSAGLTPDVHLDRLVAPDGRGSLLILNNLSVESGEITLEMPEDCLGVFSGKKCHSINGKVCLILENGEVEMLIPNSLVKENSHDAGKTCGQVSVYAG